VNPFSEIADIILWIRAKVLAIAQGAENVPLIGDWMAGPLWDIYDWLWDVYKWFNKAAWWYEDVKDAIEDILSWSNIRSLIRSWLDGIEDLIDWFSNWWNIIKAKVEEWWEETLTFVKGLIAIAVQGLDDLIEAWDTFWRVTWPEWTGNLSELRSLWDTFWTTIFPTLVSFTWLETWWISQLGEIDTLIDSTLKRWFPDFNDLVKLWKELGEFWKDPLQWAYDKLDEFFENFW